MKQKELEAWSKVRERGRTRYVAVMGGSYGVLMFLFMTFVMNRDKLSPQYLALSAAIWASGGLLFGVAMWYVGQYRYHQALARGAKQ